MVRRVTMEGDAVSSSAAVLGFSRPAFHGATSRPGCVDDVSSGRLVTVGFCVQNLEEGGTIWLTGLVSSGKTTLARALETRLLEYGHRVQVLDGDAVRMHLTKDLGFSREDRDENIRRIGFVASLLARNGIVVIASVISPYRITRDEVRALHDGRFVEVYLATPLELCEARDVKGLYALARAGRLANLTGVDDPYEPPLEPEIVIDTTGRTVDESLTQLWGALIRLPRRST